MRLGMLFGLGVAIVSSATADAVGEAYQKIREAHGAAIVTIKYVPTSPTGERQQEVEVSGTVIDPNGLVVTANTRMGYNPVTEQSITPADVRVIVGEEGEELAAELVARDSARDLAWLRLTQSAESPLTHIAFKGGAKVEVGERVFTLRRTDRFFGRTLLNGETRINALYSQPRELYGAFQLQMIAEPGLPVFNADGDAVALLAFQIPDPDTIRAMGSQLKSQDVFVLLPAAAVNRATELAREQMAATPAAEDPADAVSEEPDAAAESSDASE